MYSVVVSMKGGFYSLPRLTLLFLCIVMQIQDSYLTFQTLWRKKSNAETCRVGEKGETAKVSELSLHTTPRPLEMRVETYLDFG